MIYGPFVIYSHDATGELTDVPSTGVHYTTDAGFFAENLATLGAYRITPANPLQAVMAGDDPTNPQWTVALRFPDQATADAVISQLTSPSP